MPAQGGIGLAGGCQLLQPVVPQRLQQPVAGAARPGHRRHHRLINQAAQHAEGAFTAQRFRGRKAELSSHHRQAAEQAALVLIEQLVTPLHRGPQRLVTGRAVPAATGQQLKAPSQPLLDLAHAHQAGSRCRQLDRQRQAVQPHADTMDHIRRSAVGKPRTAISRPLGEQPNRLILRQRGQREDHLASHQQRLAAGGQHGEPCAAVHQHPGHPRAFLDQVLTVIEHQQDRSPAKTLNDPVQGRPPAHPPGREHAS